jgi:CheY-like chemotaxis protein
MYAEFLGASYEMRAVADGAAAIGEVSAHPPDVVVTDLALPGIDGFELTRRLRNDPACRATPIICLSGFISAGHGERALAAGCTRVLQKPCLPDALAEAIADVLDDPLTRSLGG